MTAPKVDLPLPPKVPGRRVFLVLPVVLAAISIRIWVAVTQVPECVIGGTGAACYGTGLSGYVFGQAADLAQGLGFTDPGMAGDPGARAGAIMPVILAAVRLVGRGGADEARLAVAVLGGLGVGAVAFLAWYVSDRRVTGTFMVAAAIAALNPVAIVAAALTLPEALLPVSTAVAVTAAFAWWRSDTRMRRVALGLALGLGMLVTGEQLAFSVLMLGAMAIWGPFPRRQRLVAASMVGVVMLATITPWALFNTVRLDGTAALGTDLGWAVGASSCESTFYGPAVGGRDPGCWTPDPGASQGEADRAAEAGRNGWEFTWSHAADLPRVAVARVAHQWGFGPTEQVMASDGTVVGQGGAFPVAAQWFWLVLIPLSVVGAVARHRRGGTLAPLMVGPAAATVWALVTGAGAGRAGSAGVSMAVLAATGVVSVADAAWRRSGRWERPGPLSVRTAVAISAALALVVRVVITEMVLPLCSAVNGLDGSGDRCLRLFADTNYFQAQATSINQARGWLNGFGLPGAEHPPMFSLLLAGLARVGVRDITQQRLALAVVGSLGVALVAKVAADLVRGDGQGRAGLLAGVLAAGYPMLWLNDTGVLSESLLVPVVALATWAILKAWDEPSLMRLVLVGGALGLVVLTRSEAVIVIPVIALALAWRRGRPLGPRLVQVTTVVVVAGLVCGPWVVYNLVRFEGSVTLTSTPWLTARYTACDSVFYGDLLGYYDIACGGDLIRGVPLGDEAAKNARAQQATTAYYRDHAGRAVVQAGASVARMFDLYLPFDNLQLAVSNEKRGWAMSASGLIWYWVMVPLAVSAVVVKRRDRRIWLVMVWLLPPVVAAAFGGGVARYRTPAEVTLVVLAGIGLWRAVYGRAESSPAVSPKTRICSSLPGADE